MKFNILCNSQQLELDIQEPTIETLKDILKNQLNIEYEFEMYTTDNQNLIELIDGMQILIKKAKQDQKNIKKFKSFFSTAGSLIKQKTLNKQYSFFHTIKQEKQQNTNLNKSNQDLVQQQNDEHTELINQTEDKQNDSIQKFELSDIQQLDSNMIHEEKQSERLLLNELQEQNQNQKQAHHSEMKKKKEEQIKQQSQTAKEQAFAYAEELANMPRLNKRQQILQRMEEDKAEKERIAKQQQEANKMIKQIQEKMKQKEALLKQKEDALIIPELEKRKAVLAQKRELSQPIRLNELTEHQKKYEEEKKLKEYERDHHKQEFEQEYKQKALKFPKSQAQIRLEEEQKLQKLLREQELEQKKQARLKQLKYADVAQEIYFKEHPSKPKQSPPPKEESKQIKEIQVTEQNIRKIKKYVQQRHLSHDSKDSINDISHHQENRPPRPLIKKIPKIEKIEKPSDLPPKPKTTDYLQQLRQQRKVQQPPIEEQWEKILENKGLESEKKVQNVLQNVQKLEQKAKEREKLALLNKDMQAEEEANNLYIASIKAKLAILEKN